jgi:hypothetical protein
VRWCTKGAQPQVLDVVAIRKIESVKNGNLKTGMLSQISGVDPLIAAKPDIPVRL